MTVSTRNTFLAGVGALALVAVGGVAYAGGMGGGSVNTPNGGPMVPGTTSGGHQNGPCCGKGPKGHGVIVPGVNVAGPNVMITGSNVTVNQGSVVTNAQSFLNTSVVSGGQSSTIISGGGGYYTPQGIAPSSIGALNVEGGEERYMETVIEKVPHTEEYCAETITMKQTLRPVQAVCLDDKGTPHPASRVDASKHVDGAYSGEVFRCMAGTNMQVTLGKLENGQASFAHGQTFACQKGEALVHRRGGNLECAPQKPQRDCNERSLLRRHGPGIKIVQAKLKAKTCVPKTRTVMKSVERQVERTRETKGQPMVFDGGVGQGVY